MFSGYLMAGVYKLGGRGGFKGWQWYTFPFQIFPGLDTNQTRLFIIDGVISLPIAILGFVVLPDVPEISNPWYLSESVRLSLPTTPNLKTSNISQEIQLAQKRMELEGRKNREPYTKAKLKKIFTSWHIYFLTILYM